MNMLESLATISGGDFKVKYTTVSKAALKREKYMFTASVRDVLTGVADIAVGPMWMTSSRLKMVPFSQPVGTLSSPCGHAPAPCVPSFPSLIVGSYLLQTMTK